MAQCKLSERQRDLLRMIADGLQARAQDNGEWWIRMAHDYSLPVWQNIDDPDLMQQLQEGTKLGDLVMFEKCGFITNEIPGRYVVVEQRLIDAVENNFTVSYERSHVQGRNRGRTHSKKT